MKIGNLNLNNNKYVKKQEGSVEFYLYKNDNDSIPSKSMGVFYNERMEINRDISILAILTYNKLINRDSLVMVDCMAASGIGSIRLLKASNNFKKIFINDINPVAVELIKRNLKLNDLEKNTQIISSHKDANLLCIEIAQKSCLNGEKKIESPNVISIDPFGTPNIYIDSAFKSIKKENGLLCITATDTAVLFGVKPKACIRKYMSKPLHTDYCKEIGARILMYYISRIANVNNLGIIPLLTFYSNHFIRIFALTYKSKAKIFKDLSNSYGYIIHCNNCGYRSSVLNDILTIPQKCPSCLKEEPLSYSGPLWIKELHKRYFLEEIIHLNEKFNFKSKNRITKIIGYALDEIGMPVSYYNIHKLCQQLKLPSIPKIEKLIEAIGESGYSASRTHFDFISIKTNMGIDALKNILKNILN